MTQVDVVVIGGGASGLMCALTAGQRGRRVVVLEKSNKLGKKILMSGGGRCNFTNRTVEPEHFLSANPHFVRSALTRYTSEDFLDLVERHRVPWHERDHGQLFCLNSAKDILDLLLAECALGGVETRTGITVTSLTPCETGGSARFRIDSPQGIWTAESVVIATGGLSIPTLGGSGWGYDLARTLGHQVLPTRAGLVPLTFSDGMKAITERLSGLAVPTTVSVPEQSFSEQLLFTHRGISGPAVLQISNYWDLGASIHIDLAPTRDLSTLLLQAKTQQPRSLLRTVLGSMGSKALVLELQALLWSAWAETPLAEIPDRVLRELAETLHHWTLKPSGTEGYRTAEVTLGGVDTRELSSRTMESQRMPGVFFLGEVVDVTGWLGGYNFQWAWSSGFVAGEAV